MSVYIDPFTFDFSTELISVDPGTTDVACIDLYEAVKAAQASAEGIQHPPIAEGSGLIELGPGVTVGITVELLGDWQLAFAVGNYVARIAGGNLVGGQGGDPVAYSAGVQTLLIQSAASTVVTEGGSVPSAVQNAAAVHGFNVPGAGVFSDVTRRQFAVIRGSGTFPPADGTYEAKDTDGEVVETGTISGSTRTAS